MKKFNIRIVALACLALISILSYSYLVGVASGEKPPKNTIYDKLEDETSKKEIYLPDVEMVKKLFRAGKALTQI